MGGFSPNSYWDGGNKSLVLVTLTIFKATGDIRWSNADNKLFASCEPIIGFRPNLVDHNLCIGKNQGKNLD